MLAITQRAESVAVKFETTEQNEAEHEKHEKVEEEGAKVALAIVNSSNGDAMRSAELLKSDIFEKVLMTNTDDCIYLYPRISLLSMLL